MIAYVGDAGYVYVCVCVILINSPTQQTPTYYTRPMCFDAVVFRGCHISSYQRNVLSEKSVFRKVSSFWVYCILFHKFGVMCIHSTRNYSIKWKISFWSICFAYNSKSYCYTQKNEKSCHFWSNTVYQKVDCNIPNVRKIPQITKTSVISTTTM